MVEPAMEGPHGQHPAEVRHAPENGKFSFENIDANPDVPKGFKNISRFFRNEDGEKTRHGLDSKKVFAAGTAPMRDTSEIATLLYLTDFDELTCLDPAYGSGDSLKVDLDEIKKFADSVDNTNPTFEINERGQRFKRIHFTAGGKERKITFVAANATDPKNMPENFNIFVGGRRSSEPIQGSYLDEITSTAPVSIRDGMPQIIARLADNGYIIPDIDLDDDTGYFSVSLGKLGLEEVSQVREKNYSRGVSSIDKFDKRNAAIHAYLYETFREGKFNPPIDGPNGKTTLRDLVGTSSINFLDITQQLNDSVVKLHDTGVNIGTKYYSYSQESQSTEDLDKSSASQNILREAVIKGSEAIEVKEHQGLGLYKRVSQETAPAGLFFGEMTEQDVIIVDRQRTMGNKLAEIDPFSITEADLQHLANFQEALQAANNAKFSEESLAVLSAAEQEMPRLYTDLLNAVDLSFPPSQNLLSDEAWVRFYANLAENISVHATKGKEQFNQAVDSIEQLYQSDEHFANLHPEEREQLLVLVTVLNKGKIEAILENDAEFKDIDNRFVQGQRASETIGAAETTQPQEEITSENVGPLYDSWNNYLGEVGYVVNLLKFAPAEDKMSVIRMNTRNLTTLRTGYDNQRELFQRNSDETLPNLTALLDERTLAKIHALQRFKNSQS